MVLGIQIAKKDCNTKIGEYVTSLEGYTIYNKNIDIYDKETTKLIAKFRKNIIDSPENIKAFIENIKPLIRRKKENRGAAAGIIDRQKLRESVGELYNNRGTRTNYYLKNGKKSNTGICNYAKSNVIGYIDTAVRDKQQLSERVNLCAYCRQNPEKYKACIPLLNELNGAFKMVDYERHFKQHSDVNDKFRIEKTAFSTVTCNYSWQSAAHRDGNNGKESYAVITVLKDHLNKNDYVGGHLLFPEYKVGFNIEEGDFFLGDTQTHLHCNSPITPVSDKVDGKWPGIDIKNNWHLNRISLVCYIKKTCLK